MKKISWGSVLFICVGWCVFKFFSSGDITWEAVGNGFLMGLLISVVQAWEDEIRDLRFEVEALKKRIGVSDNDDFDHHGQHEQEAS